MSSRAGIRVFAAAVALLLLVPSVRAEPFVMMFYNVQNWLTTDRSIKGQSVSSSPKPEAEKSAVITIIAAHRPAILGVCEMGTREDLEDFRRRLEAAGLHFPHVEWHEGLDTDRHLALLSRFPIVARNSQSRIVFDLGGQPEGVQRGILDVTVEPRAGYPLRLIGLHLKSRRPVPEVDQEALRAKEAWFVRKYLDDIFAQDPGTRLLLFGDLNTTKNDYAIRQIKGPCGPDGLTDLRLEDAHGERWTHFYTLADEYSRIDYLMTSKALRPDIKLAASGIDSSSLWSDASDHRAIFATIDPQ